MSKKKIYISSPITGYNLNERHKFFARIENELTILGYKAVNPMAKSMSDSAPYTEHMKETYACSSAATALSYRTDGVAQRAVKRNAEWRTLAEYPS